MPFEQTFKLQDPGLNEQLVAFCESVGSQLQAVGMPHAVCLALIAEGMFSLAIVPAAPGYQGEVARYLALGFYRLDRTPDPSPRSGESSLHEIVLKVQAAQDQGKEPRA